MPKLRAHLPMMRREASMTAWAIQWRRASGISTAWGMIWRSSSNAFDVKYFDRPQDHIQLPSSNWEVFFAKAIRWSSSPARLLRGVPRPNVPGWRKVFMSCVVSIRPPRTFGLLDRRDFDVIHSPNFAHMIEIMKRWYNFSQYERKYNLFARACYSIHALR